MLERTKRNPATFPPRSESGFSRELVISANIAAPDGTRCAARTGLEIDHERPFAIYRSHEEHHLAERVYGAEFIRAKIDAKKRAS